MHTQSSHKNKLYLLALNRIPGIGPRITQKLLKSWPELELLFKLPVHELIQAGLSATIAKAINNFNFSDLDADLTWEQQSQHHHLLTLHDPAYPSLLREIHDPPIVLYAKGDLSALQDKTLAIVGTRNPSASGRNVAKKFAYELASQHITIISGLALGIDSEAHWGCMQAQGQTIAVLGTGVNQIYPTQHQALAEKITEKGLLISEFPLNTSPVAGHFPRRNRIISGLSLGILVVEAALKSGSLITARLALEQNRDVMAIPGSIHNPQATGCHSLRQQRL